MWTIAFSTSSRPICRTRSGSPTACGAAVPGSDLERVVVRERHRTELVGDRLCERLEVEDLGLEADPAGVEPGQVEQVSGQPGQAGNLLAHRREELAARVLVEVLVVHQLEESAEREEGRPELVGRVGDELLPGIVQLGEAQPHAVEGARELAELVQAVVDHRLRRTVRTRCGRRRAPGA